MLRAIVLKGAIPTHTRRVQYLNRQDMLLFDDVMALGATLSDCAHACKTAKINALFANRIAAHHSHSTGKCINHYDLGEI